MVGLVLWMKRERDKENEMSAWIKGLEKLVDKGPVNLDF